MEQTQGTSGLNKRLSIYDRIGFKGLLNVVWNSTPHHLRVAVLPYSLTVYYSLLHRSSTLEELLDVHSYEYHRSQMFKWWRSRYNKAKGILQGYGIS